jgi:hypothetical protein
MTENLPLVFAELLAAGVLIVKGARMFAGAFGGDGGSGQQVEELGQAAAGSPDGPGAIPGAGGLAGVLRGAHATPVQTFVTAWGVVYVVLSVMALAAPGVAAGFAMLVMTADLLANVPDLAKQINQVEGQVK